MFYDDVFKKHYILRALGHLGGSYGSVILQIIGL